jgi:ABC-type transporter Mla subunit MlaD
LFIKSAIAFWPVFDFTEIVPIYSQVSTSINSLKNIKDQLKQLTETLNAIGKTVGNVGSFVKDISDKIENVADEIASVGDFVGDNLNEGKNLVDNLKQSANNIVNASGQVAQAVSGLTGNLELNKPVLREDNPLDTLPEEEEEEEEVSKEEELAQIEAVKESVKMALDESKNLNVQFNDLLDVSIHTINTNSEKNGQTIAKLEKMINNAENLSIEEKQDFISKLSSLKEEEKTISVKMVSIIEAMKESYNLAYKNKIEDGYKNYENISIAYIKGDAEKKELEDVAKALVNGISSMQIAPDDSVLTELGLSIEDLEKKFASLGDNIRKVEEKNRLKNS